jgi:hypothetical protein
MTDDMARIKWHPIDLPAARQLTSLTTSPGMVYGLGPNALPAQLQQLPNVCSYYVSAYSNAIPAPRGMLVGGEMLVARVGDALTKNDQFVFGTSSNGQVFFAGPFKNFDGHHVSSGQQYHVTSMFNNTPFSPKA